MTFFRCQLPLADCKVAVVTAPCISFSMLLDCRNISVASARDILRCKPIFTLMRYGKRDGFKNREQHDVHLAAVHLQRKTEIHIHENVNGYDEVLASDRNIVQAP